jgi:hypothetical protein
MRSNLGLFAILSLITIVGLYGCSEVATSPGQDTHPAATPMVLWDGVPCGEALTVPFYAGQFIDVGSVVVANDENELCIQIETSGGWMMTETHVAIARTPEEFPQTGSGNPKVGQFALSAEHDPAVTSFDHCIFLEDYGYLPGETLFVAVHAAVVLEGEGGEVMQEETAWADGYEFEGNSWATYFSYGVQECVIQEECTLVVVSPALGEVVCVFEPFWILWDTTGSCTGELIRLELLVDGELCEEIDVVANDGSGEYEWAEPWDSCGYPEDGYSIRVTVLGEENFSGVSPTFSFDDCSSGGEE